MDEARLTPAIEISALIRRAEAAGGFAAVLRRGDPDRGAVLVVLVARLDPPILLERVLAPSGGYAWQRRDFADSHAIGLHVERVAKFDPDIWVVELDIPLTERFIAEMI